jgi:hypothetical protein
LLSKLTVKGMGMMEPADRAGWFGRDGRSKMAIVIEIKTKTSLAELFRSRYKLHMPAAVEFALLFSG